MFDWLFRLHLPSIKEYSFKTTTTSEYFEWGQYIIIDEPPYLCTGIDPEDHLYTTYC